MSNHSKWKERWKQFGSLLREGFQKFWFSLMLVYGASISMMIYMHQIYHIPGYKNYFLIRMAITLVLGAILTAGGTLLGRFSSKGKYTIFAGLVGVSILFGFWFFHPDRYFFEAKFFLILGTTIFLFLGLYANQKGEKVLEQIRVLFTHFVSNVLYSIFLFGGCSLILGILILLFRISIPSVIWQDLLFFSMGMFFPTLFLTTLPQVEETNFSYPLILNTLMKYVFIPLSTLTIGIFVIYGVKVIFEKTLPSNLIASLFLSVGYVIYGILIFSKTMRQGKLLKVYKKWVPKGMFILLLLAGYSLIIRICQYGLTERRVFGVYGWIFLLIQLSFISIGNWRQVRKGVFAFACLLFLSAIGPFSLENISYQSQKSRFFSLAQGVGIRNGEVVELNRSGENVEELLSVLYYCKETEKTEILSHVKGVDDFQEIESLFQNFHLEYREKKYFFVERSFPQIWEVSSATHIVILNQQNTTGNWEGGKVQLTEEFQKILLISENGEEESISIAEDIEKIAKQELFQEDGRIAENSLHLLNYRIQRLEGHYEGSKIHVDGIEIVLFLSK